MLGTGTWVLEARLDRYDSRADVLILRSTIFWLAQPSRNGRMQNYVVTSSFSCHEQIDIVPYR